MLTLAGKPLAVPVLQGGMGVGVSLGGLAGAVAACGGMGCISTADTGYREPDFARDPYAANLRALKKEIAKGEMLLKCRMQKSTLEVTYQRTRHGQNPMCGSPRPAR